MVTSEWDVLVLDLDGTLLCKQGAVSDQNLHALEEVRNSGVEIVVATGRSFAECKHIVNQIEHKGACITAGGSQLTCSEGEAISREIVCDRVVEQVTNEVVKNGHRSLLLKDETECDVQYVLVGEAPLHHASEWWFDTLGISVHEVDTLQEDPWPGHTLRVGAVAEKSTLSPIANSLTDALRGKAKLQHWSAVTCSEATGSSTHLLEVFGSEVSKWEMLKRHLGDQLEASRIVAIGDGLNDIEVLSEVELSIVMENANEDVLSYANVIAGHHDEHGFADAMHRWVIQRTSAGE